MALQKRPVWGTSRVWAHLRCDTSSCAPASLQWPGPSPAWQSNPEMCSCKCPDAHRSHLQACGHHSQAASPEKNRSYTSLVIQWPIWTRHLETPGSYAAANRGCHPALNTCRRLLFSLSLKPMELKVHAGGSGPLIAVHGCSLCSKDCGETCAKGQCIYVHERVIVEERSWQYMRQGLWHACTKGQCIYVLEWVIVKEQSCGHRFCLACSKEFCCSFQEACIVLINVLQCYIGPSCRGDRCASHRCGRDRSCNRRQASTGQ